MLFRKIIYAFTNLYVKRSVPTLVYAPGRVGSMGLLKNLRKAGVFSFKIEFLESEPRGSAKFVKRFILNQNRHANVITLIREPIGMMLSYFLDKSVKGWIPESKSALEQGDTNALRQIFVNEVLNTYRLESYLYWFENEFNKYLKTNVYDRPFDHAKKFAQFQNGNYRILLLRTDLPDDQKADCINTFLDKTSVAVTRENQGKDKSYGELQRELRESMGLTPQILDRIYSAPYVQHFFSPAEIAALKQQWSNGAK